MGGHARPSRDKPTPKRGSQTGIAKITFRFEFLLLFSVRSRGFPPRRVGGAETTT